MGLTELVMKDILPRNTLVPILINIEIPITARNSSGSIHEVVDSARMMMTAGTSTYAAFSTSVPAACWTVARSGAWPATALSGPISSCMAAVVFFSMPSAMVTERSALPFL